MKILLCILMFISLLYSQQDLPNKINDNIVFAIGANHLSLNETKKIVKILRDSSNKKLKKLLDDGLDPNSALAYKFPIRILHAAVYSENIGAVKLLINYGANPNVLAIKGFIHTPLTSAIIKNNLRITKYLLEHNASLNIEEEMNFECKGSYVEPPFFYAKTKEMIELLVSNGAKIKQQTRNGETILDNIDDLTLKSWLIKKYNLPTKYFKCGTQFINMEKIIKVTHTNDGYKEYDANDNLVYEVKNGKTVFQK
ncbi:ankyrin repeat domain-containing protein [Sulfurimonas sp.]|uniref:ankyrin repeat domain-containing protein n=1 Tax=Sulfurimonas sp. TaxID=2022749 RepID=UPI003D0DDC9F